MVRLDARLSTVAQLLGRCGTLVDVGSNHGRLGVYMAQNGLCERAILTDISPDALEKGKALVSRTGLQQKVETIVCDGVTGIALAPKDAVAICGMGARTILHILGDGLPCRAVVQANVETAFLREQIQRIGMRIGAEALAKENGRWYVAMLLLPEEEVQPLTRQGCVLGRFLQNDALYTPYLLWREGVVRRAVEGAALGGSEEKREAANMEYTQIQQAMKEANLC